MHEQHRLLAGREGEESLAALVVVEVVDLGGVVEHRPEATGAVEEDDALAELAGFVFRERELAVDTHAHPRCLFAKEHPCLVGLAELVAIGKRCDASSLRVEGRDELVGRLMCEGRVHRPGFWRRDGGTFQPSRVVFVQRSGCRQQCHGVKVGCCEPGLEML